MFYIYSDISCKVWQEGSIVHMFLFNVVGGLNAFEGFFDSYSGPNNNVMYVAWDSILKSLYATEYQK